MSDATGYIEHTTQAESPDTGTVMAVLRSGEAPLVVFISG